MYAQQGLVSVQARYSIKGPEDAGAQDKIEDRRSDVNQKRLLMFIKSCSDLCYGTCGRHIERHYLALLSKVVVVVFLRS